MLPEDKPIYKKVYHRDTADDMELPCDPYAGLEAFKQRLRESKYILREDRVGPGKTFVEEVKAFSRRYRLDTTIVQRAYYIEADLQGLAGPYDQGFTKEFVELTTMCDRIGFDAGGEEPGSVTVSLEFDTHDFYFGDKKFNDVW